LPNLETLSLTPLSAVYSNAGESNAWNPIPSLVRNDADVSLFFFTANSVEYVDQVNDPFFLAEYSDAEPAVGTGPTVYLYQPTDTVNIMGCIDQYRICNPNSGACSSRRSACPLGSNPIP